MNAYELETHYDNRKSFYGKAIVMSYYDKDLEIIELKSYNTRVAKIIGGRNGVAIVTDTHSHTTLRHIKEFLKQQGFKADTKQQILNDYDPKLSLRHSVL